MHILQPKHSKLSEKETQDLLDKINISKTQLPKIKLSDVALPDGIVVGDVIKIERKQEDKVFTYFRVVI